MTHDDGQGSQISTHSTCALRPVDSFQHFANQIKDPKSIPSHYYAIQQQVSHGFLSE